MKVNKAQRNCDLNLTAKYNQLLSFKNGKYFIHWIKKIAVLFIQIFQLTEVSYLVKYNPH